MPQADRKPYIMMLAAAAVTLLAILSLLPATGWLVRAQLLSQFLPQGDGAAAEQRVADTHPNDYPIQLARVLTAAPDRGGPLTSDVKVQRLRELAARFPNEPSVYAHSLRYAAQGQVKLKRIEENELSASPFNAASYPAAQPAPEALAAFDSDAAAGERLDPNNAYFPLMRAAGLFAAHRDSEAIAAIHRAGQKTRFDDYTSDEFLAMDRLSKLAHGQNGAVARLTTAATMLFPHFMLLRGTARLGTVSAIHAELNGHAEEGFEIRRDIMRTGALMRVQGHSLICSLVGIAMAAIPSARPGGAPAEKAAGNLSAVQQSERAAARQEKYCAYLRSIGHAPDADWAEAERKASLAARETARKATDLSTFGLGSLGALGFWWLADLLTLTNAVSLLILCAAAAAAAGIRPKHRLKLWRGVLVLATAAVFALWFGNVGRGIAQWSSSATQLAQMANDGPSPDGVRTMQVFGAAVGLVISTGVPLLMLAGIAIASRIFRVPVATGIGRGLRGLALPVACGLFLLYGPLLFGTVRQEAALNAYVDGMVSHEGEMMASQVGATWPGPVR